MKLNLKKKIKEKFTYLYCDLRNDHNFDLVKLSEINPKKYPFLLESSSRGNKLNRSSILFFSPKTVLVKEKNDQYNFFNKLNEIWQSEKLKQASIVHDKYKIPFFGGWFVYLGYEMAKEIEQTLDLPNSPFSLPDAFAARVNTAIIFDNVNRRLFLVSDKTNDYQKDFDEILEDISKIESKKKKNPLVLSKL